jgi:hypothetical protein
MYYEKKSKIEGVLKAISGFTGLSNDVSGLAEEACGLITGRPKSSSIRTIFAIASSCLLIAFIRGNYHALTHNKDLALVFFAQMLIPFSSTRSTLYKAIEICLLTYFYGWISGIYSIGALL